MKKLLSIWSGRLMSVLLPLALISSFLVPASALARKEMSNGGGNPDGSEGDPLDTNDFGSGGGGGDSNVHDQSSAGSFVFPWVVQFDLFQILLIPDFVNGTLVYKIVIIDKSDLGMGDLSLEGPHAP